MFDIKTDVVLTVYKEPDMEKIKEKFLIMTYSQYHRARNPVHQCCNYDSGNCLAFDGGKNAFRAQSTLYFLSCNWFCAPAAFG